MSAIGPFHVARFPRNRHGRDFVVGDIHGCFDAVRAAMGAVGFRESADRLFSVGDLVDRGPCCGEVAEWIAYPWFFAARGNHEQAAIGIAAGQHDSDRYRDNGGGWFLDLPASRRELIASVLDTLPLAIEIDRGGACVGLVHAAVPGGDWRAFTAAVAAPQSQNLRKKLASTAMHSRARIDAGDTSPVAGVDIVFVGHSPVTKAGVLGNVAFVDTGAVFGGTLTLADMADWLPPAAVPAPVVWPKR